MIVRIVHMHFQASEISKFQQLFDQYKEEIRNQPACGFLSNIALVAGQTILNNAL